MGLFSINLSTKFLRIVSIALVSVFTTVVSSDAVSTGKTD